MVSALIGLVGVIGGLILGGTGKYFNQRRDAWLQARAAGLLLLADIRTLCDDHTEKTDTVVAETALGAKSWESQRRALAGFRRGTYPSGVTASEWLKLAGLFAKLDKINKARGENWWTEAKRELIAVKLLLAQFERDPPVLPSVARTGWHNTWVWLRSSKGRKAIAAVIASGLAVTALLYVIGAL
jgi:hypothetical protein